LNGSTDAVVIAVKLINAVIPLAGYKNASLHNVGAEPDR